MTKWLAGIVASVIAGVLVFWLTEGQRQTKGQKSSYPQTDIYQRSIDISGRWATVRGVNFYISQNGDRISYYVTDGNGAKMADGYGTISGHFIELVDQSPDSSPTVINQKCELSTDRQRMTCLWNHIGIQWAGVWIMRSGGTDKMTLYRK